MALFKMNSNLFLLSWILMRKDLETRFRGTLLGLIWIVLLPVLMAILYTAVFWGVFQSRWPSIGPPVDPMASRLHSAVGFGAQLFAGLVVFNFFIDLMVRSTRLISENATLVKRIRFPQLSLVLSLVMTNLVTLVIGLVLSILGALVATSTWQLSLIGLFISLVQMITLGLGIVLWISAVSVYLRDLQQVISAIATALLFLSPVFYSRQAAPGVLQSLLEVNPLSYSIEGIRTAIYQGSLPDLGSTLLAYLLAVLVLSSGFWVFRRLRPGFADMV